MQDAGVREETTFFAVPPTLVLPLPMHSHVRRTVLAGVKFALAAGILAYLLVTGRDAIAKMSERTIEWPLLGAALVCTLATATLSFVRWHLLIRAVGIDVRLVDSLRLVRWASR